MPRRKSLKIKIAGTDWQVKYCKAKIKDDDGCECHGMAEEAKRLIRIADNEDHNQINTLLHEIGHAYLRNHESIMAVEGLEEAVANVFAEAIEELYSQQWFHDLMKKDS